MHCKYCRITAQIVAPSKSKIVYEAIIRNPLGILFVTIFFFLFCVIGFAQQSIEVKGKIVDAATQNLLKVQALQ